MKTSLSLIVVAGLTSCGNMETRSGPYRKSETISSEDGLYLND
ncbi:MAG: hypothetical protein NTW21_03340 [Verrucomicrobia bacterium]|nr:hypothetical protein [Verrucomicrobiota bacterium]